MRKIPTLFRRDPDDMRRLLPEVHPDCQWVLDREGVATRKYDGTCVKYDGTEWWARREVKPGKRTPDGFVAVERDDDTGKTVGWEPAEQSPFLAFLDEAERVRSAFDFWLPGTYELCGPKINGNPEGFNSHVLISHADADILDGIPRDFDGLAALLTDYFPHEGIVWHRKPGDPDTDMAKIKHRDFPIGAR